MGHRIELIDARRLAQLLVTNGGGVQEGQTVRLYRLDEDVFEGLSPHRLSTLSNISNRIERRRIP